ncbi:hypothetical protein LY90DRAFT_669234 [Neocallimastix californiae]|uniref:Uncharacterized protein n=1 Tax=Neocallimastix californiae TaxID=1754190 RepID=A0A1Y2DCN2_9FUNG|nr:hypothetical protein LY90DRAFT_669234 [Neocallimastix californiae]|eukprot:ORY57032.1 hypothetical protein LY90DRAFT_669234 [Neocallimastix californiae]
MVESNVIKNIRQKLTKAFNLIEYDIKYPKNNDIEIVKNALKEPYMLFIEQSSLNLNKFKYFNSITQNEYNEARMEFVNSFYQHFLEFIIEYVCVNWYPCFSQEEKKQLFENYFIPEKNVESYEYFIHRSFYVIVHHISLKEHNFIMENMTKFLEKFLKYNTVSNFLNIKKELDDSLWSQYIQLISFLPDKMVSIYKLETNNFFLENNYFKKIGLEISQAIILISSQKEFEKYKIQRLEMLISKLFRLGKTDAIAEPLYCDMKKRIKDSSYKNVISCLIRSLNMVELEKLFDFIIKQFQQTKDNAISLISILQNFINTWLDSYFMNNASKLQHQNITYGILICLSYLNQEDFSQTDIEIKFLKGVGKYLESTKYDIRTYGMVIAESFSEKLNRTERKLDFELTETDEIIFLRSLVKENLETYAQEHSELITNNLNDQIEEDDDDNNTIDNNNYKQDDFSEDENPDEIVSELDITYDNSSEEETDDDDDDLEPYYMEEEEEITSAEELKNKIKPPLYISDCINGLVAEEEPNKIEISINAAPDLIKSCGSNDIKEFGIRLCSVLLSISNNYELDNFEENRQESINNLLVKDPILIAPFICEQFYQKNYNLSQRFIMLNALSSASNTLSSFLDNSKEEKEDKDTIEIDNIIDRFSELNKDQNSEDESLKNDFSPIKIIAKRIEQHTHRFSRKSLIKKKIIKENKFLRYAKYFFFPLIGKFDCTNELFTLLNKSEQSLLLERLILTLGIITYCSMNSLDCRRMCRELWNFVGLIVFMKQNHNDVMLEIQYFLVIL